MTPEDIRAAAMVIVEREIQVWAARYPVLSSSAYAQGGAHQVDICDLNLTELTPWGAIAAICNEVMDRAYGWQCAIRWGGCCVDMGENICTAVRALVPVPRCGDEVLVPKTEETLFVAWAEGDHFSWCGWPNGTMDLAECVLVRRCSDEEHREVCEDVVLCGDSRSAYVRRLYAGALACPSS